MEIDKMKPKGIITNIDLEKFKQEKEMEKIENLYGVKDTKELLIFLFAIGELYQGVMEDNKVTMTDLQYAPRLLTTIIPKFNKAFEGIKNIPLEITDELTDVEIDEIIVAIRDAKLDPKWSAKIELAIEIGQKFNELFR